MVMMSASRVWDSDSPEPGGQLSIPCRVAGINQTQCRALSSPQPRAVRSVWAQALHHVCEKTLDKPEPGPGGVGGGGWPVRCRQSWGRGPGLHHHLQAGRRPSQAGGLEGGNWWVWGARALQGAVGATAWRGAPVGTQLAPPYPAR